MHVTVMMTTAMLSDSVDHAAPFDDDDDDDADADDDDDDDGDDTHDDADADCDDDAADNGLFSLQQDRIT